MYLGTFAVVLVLTSEAFVLEPVKYFSDRLRRLCKHGLEWNAWRELAFIRQLVNAGFQ